MPSPGRNEPCPCGSGRKFKHCCGNAAQPVTGLPTPADRNAEEIEVQAAREAKEGTGFDVR